jgi:hypothetical protein
MFWVGFFTRIGCFGVLSFDTGSREVWQQSVVFQSVFYKQIRFEIMGVTAQINGWFIPIFYCRHDIHIPYVMERKKVHRFVHQFYTVS